MRSYDDLNILFSSHYSDDYIRVPQFSSRQVTSGPFCKDKSNGNQLVSLQTPVGQYDIRKIIDKLPNDQKPELLIVKADATRVNHPINVANLPIPKLLIIGDTMHQRRPIQTMLSYAIDQKFDYYVADHCRRHLHFFHQVGINAHWLPGVLTRTWGIPFQQVREIPLSFVGQAGRFHPHRQLLLNRLKNDKFSLLQTRASQEQASLIYSNSSLTLNLSMMGDINLRVFEALSCGGFLITDNVSPQAGNEILFKDQEHLVLFKNYEDLKSKIQYYLQYPEEAISIAKQGYQEFWRNHSPDKKRQQLLSLVFEDELLPFYDGKTDKRSVVFPIKTKEKIAERVRSYEYIQSIHRVVEQLTVLFLTGSDQVLLSDLVDLPRCELHCAFQVDDDLVHANVADQIRTFKIQSGINTSLAFDIAVIGLQSVSSSVSMNYLKRAKIKRIIVASSQISPHLNLFSEIDRQMQILGYIPLKHEGATVYHLNTQK